MTIVKDILGFYNKDTGEEMLTYDVVRELCGEVAASTTGNWLPANCVSLSAVGDEYVFKIIHKCERLKISVEVNRSYEDDDGNEQTETEMHNYNLPCHNLFFSIAATKHGDNYIVNTKDTLLSMFIGEFTPTATLYDFPYGNVYDDGHICWGAIGIGALRFKDYELGAVASMFLSSEFNNDLTSLIADGRDDVYEVYDDFDGKESLDVSYLNVTSRTVKG